MSSFFKFRCICLSTFSLLLLLLLLCVCECAFLPITQFYFARVASLSLFFVLSFSSDSFAHTLLFLPHSINFLLLAHYRKHSLFAQCNEFVSFSISFSLFSVMVTSCFEYLFS